LTRFAFPSAILDDITTLVSSSYNDCERLERHAIQKLLASTLNSSGRDVSGYWIQAIVAHEAGKLAVVRATDVYKW
jgi:hypothetical protein